MSLCKYSNALGEPNVGFHSTRIGDFALWDILGTIVIMIVIVLLGDRSFASILMTIIGVSGLTVGLHWLFCVPTAFNKKLGL